MKSEWVGDGKYYTDWGNPNPERWVLHVVICVKSLDLGDYVGVPVQSEKLENGQWW